MATGTSHITIAMQYLQVLAPGGVPNAGQLTQGNTILNEMLGGFQAAGMLGFSKTTTITGKSSTVGVSTAAVVTQTEIGGTVTTVLTPVVVALYANNGVDNTYPSGWDEMIDFNLALNLSGPMGVAKVPEWVVKRAAETRAALTPAPIQEVKVGAGS